MSFIAKNLQKKPTCRSTDWNLEEMKRLLYIISVFVCTLPSYAQYEVAIDSTLLYENPALGKMLELQSNLSDFVFKQESSIFDRKPSFRILPSVKRTPGYGFSFGLGGAVSFYTDKTDLRLQRSEIPLYVSVAFTKPFSYSIGCEPLFYFAGNAFLLKAEISYRDWLEYYFGVGYSICHNPTYEKDLYTYESRLIRFKPSFQFRMGNDNLYGGVVIDVWNEQVKNPEQFVCSDPHYLKLVGNVDKPHSATGTGVGVNVTYDSRDIPNDAYRGLLLSAESMLYTTAFGGNTRYGTLTIDYRQYMQLCGRKQVLAWNVTSNNVFGNDIPFMRYATIGGVNNFRGYYNYQYRDKSMLTAQIEYRYWLQINSDWGILLNRFGFAVWAGTGAIGTNPVRYEALLPQAGVGLRFALRDRLNFRFDVAHNPVDNDTMWYISFSEAF